MSDSSILSATTVLHKALICKTEFFGLERTLGHSEAVILATTKRFLSSYGPHWKSKQRCPFIEWVTVHLRINGRHFHPFSFWDLKLTGSRPLLLNYLVGVNKKIDTADWSIEFHHHLQTAQKPPKQNRIQITPCCCLSVLFKTFISAVKPAGIDLIRSFLPGPEMCLSAFHRLDQCSTTTGCV